MNEVVEWGARKTEKPAAQKRGRRNGPKGVRSLGQLADGDGEAGDLAAGGAPVQDLLARGLVHDGRGGGQSGLSLFLVTQLHGFASYNFV